MGRKFGWCALVLVGLLVGCAQTPRRTVVLWVSVDGFRYDYVDKANTPFLHKLMKEGAYSKQFNTIVPSLTFSSHDSEATGVTVADHGIPANSFYDSATKTLWNYPVDASLLQSEPIWLTAKRQGIRTLVYDWPMSMKQRGEIRDDYFRDDFDKTLTDEQRLDAVLDTWRKDSADQPLQLLMGYIKETDVIGHKNGPDSPEIKAAIETVDRELSQFISRATDIFKQKMSKGDELMVMFTTDHGMMPVKTLVNYKKLFTKEVPASVRFVTSGPLGMIWFDEVPTAQAAELETSMLAELKSHPFLEVYTRDTLPKEWGMAHPTRVGDIVFFCKPGYTFSERLPLATFDVARADGPLGMHGYPPAESADMAAFCVFWRYGRKLGGKDLGPVNALQLHPTVAKLLGVKPAEGAKATPLKVK